MADPPGRHSEPRRGEESHHDRILRRPSGPPQDDVVLDFLRESNDQPISGEEISEKLGVSRSAVWKEIQHLRSLGYEIEAQPHLGYRLRAAPDKLFADEIRFRLDTQLMGKQIFSYDSLDSTNETCFELGKQGSAEGTCVFAEFQKKGRGRLGRSWVSPKEKNILFSALLRPKLIPQEVSKVTLMAALAVVRTLRAITNKSFGIKWPNDILSGEKKVAGILTELSAEADRVNFVVVGIGLNVNSAAKDLAPGATSIQEVTGQAVDRVNLAKELLRAFDREYRRFQENRFGELAKDWEEFSVTSGRRVSAALFDREIHGQAVGIDADGALWIRQDNGLQTRILSGDIKHLR